MPSAALHPRPRITAETKEFPLTYVYVFLFFLFSYFSWRKRERSTSTIWSWPTSCAHSTSIPRLWWLPPRWVRRRAAQHLSRPTTSSSEPFSPFDISVPPIYHDTHIFLPLVPAATTAPYTPQQGSIVEELSPLCVYQTFSFTDRCPLHLQQPHSISIIPPYYTACCFTFLSGPIDHWPWRLFRIKTLDPFKGCVSWIP